MRSRVCFKVSVAMLSIVVVAAMVVGCGKAEVDLSFDESPTNPVITYYIYKAIAPIYNPTVPVTIVYGDGTVISKQGPYEFTQGKLGSGGVEGLLEQLESEGFFGLKSEYEGEPLEGGATDELTVRLKEKTYDVTVQGGAGPATWNDIVKTVTDVQTADATEAVPPAVRLFATAAEGAPSAQTVMEWPGSSDDLEKASTSGSEGYRLEGPEAEAAWKAVQGTSEEGGEVFWKAGDKFYYYVYAVPLFAGVPED